MMRTIRVVTVCLTVAVLGVVLVVQADASPPDEPPLQFEVQVGDQTVRVSETSPGKLEGTDTEVSVRVLPTRTFSNAGVSFQYPRTYNFEYDGDSLDVKIWTVEGPDLTLVVYAFTDAVSVDAFAQDVKESLEKSRIEKVATPLRVNGRATPSSSVVAAVQGFEIRSDIYELSNDGRSSVLLMAQIATDDVAESEEYERTMKLFAETFSVEAAEDAPGPPSDR